MVVRGVNWLGDAVMTTPALVRLREAFPEAQITLLTHEKLADLWRHQPVVDEVLTFRQGEGVWPVSRKLRHGGFDLALLLPNSPRSAIEAWLAGIPRRVGLRWPWRNLFLTQAVAPASGVTRMRKRTVSEIQARLAANLPREAPAPQSHHLYHYLHLVSALGASAEPLAPCLRLTEEERTTGAARLFERAVQNSKAGTVWFGLNPGAEYGPAKRWPVERFIETANVISQQTGCRWMVFGGPQDRPLAEEVLAGVPSAASLCGQTTLRELMMGLGRCRLLLTNDTGPMHLAAALGTPVVALFGSTSPELTGPGWPGANTPKRNSALWTPEPQRPLTPALSPDGGEGEEEPVHGEGKPQILEASWGQEPRGPLTPTLSHPMGEGEEQPVQGKGRHQLLTTAVGCAPCYRRTCPVDFRCMKNITVERVARAAMEVWGAL